MKVLICGSGYSISQVDKWDLSSHVVVALNNAWARVKWNYFCCPDDYLQDYNKSIGLPNNIYPVDINDPKPNQNWYNQQCIETSVERSGGGNECGYGITLAAAYTVAEHFKDKIQSIGFIGCDLVYKNNIDTAYYGRGVDYTKRNISDPQHMASIMRTLRREDINPMYNKRWGSLTDDELFNYLFTRLANFVSKEYGIGMYNYSEHESKLPFERVKFPG